MVTSSADGPQERGRVGGGTRRRTRAKPESEPKQQNEFDIVSWLQKPAPRNQRTKEKITRWLRARQPIFCSQLSRVAQARYERMLQLADHMQCMELQRGQLLYKEATVGDQYYIVLSGKIDLFRKTVPLHQIAELDPDETTSHGYKVAVKSIGEGFGEGALKLSSPLPREETAVAGETDRGRDGVFIVTINRDAYYDCMAPTISPSGHVEDHGETSLQTRMRHLLNIGALRHWATADEDKAELLELLCEKLKDVIVEEGKFLFTEGQRVDSVFIMFRGTVNCLSPPQHVSTSLRTVSAAHPEYEIPSEQKKGEEVLFTGEVILEIAGPLSIFGLSPVMNDFNHFSCHGLAETRVHAFSLSAQIFKELIIERGGSKTYEMLSELAARRSAWAYQRKIAALRHPDSEIVLSLAMQARELPCVHCHKRGHIFRSAKHCVQIAELAVSRFKTKEEKSSTNQSNQNTTLRRRAPKAEKVHKVLSDTSDKKVLQRLRETVRNAAATASATRHRAWIKALVLSAVNRAWNHIVQNDIPSPAWGLLIDDAATGVQTTKRDRRQKRRNGRKRTQYATRKRQGWQQWKELDASKAGKHDRSTDLLSLTNATQRLEHAIFPRRIICGRVSNYRTSYRDSKKEASARPVIQAAWKGVIEFSSQNLPVPEPVWSNAEETIKFTEALTEETQTGLPRAVPEHAVSPEPSVSNQKEATVRVRSEVTADTDGGLLLVDAEQNPSMNAVLQTIGVTPTRPDIGAPKIFPPHARATTRRACYSKKKNAAHLLSKLPCYNAEQSKLKIGWDT